MKKSRFSEEQMVKILREADRSPVAEVAKRQVLAAHRPGECRTSRAERWGGFSLECRSGSGCSWCPCA